MSQKLILLNGRTDSPRIQAIKIAHLYTSEGKPIEISTKLENTSHLIQSLDPFTHHAVLQTEEGLISGDAAIARFLSYQDSNLYGNTIFESSLVDQWVDFVKTELEIPLESILVKHSSFVNIVVRAAKILDGHLETRTFLATERLSLADIVGATTLIDAYTKLFDAKIRKTLPHLTRWFLTLVNQTYFKQVVGDVTLCSKPIVSNGTSAPKKKPEVTKPAAKVQPVASKSIATVDEVLALIGEKGINNTYETSQAKGWDHQQLIGVLKKIEAHEGIQLKLDEAASKKTHFEFTDEAKTIIAQGTPEARCFNAIPQTGTINKSELDKIVGEDIKIAWSHCMKQKWVTFDKSSNSVSRNVESIVDQPQIDLASLKESQDNGFETKLSQANITALQKRKLISPFTIKSYSVIKLHGFSLKLEEFVSELTPEMIINETWKTAKFKDYNFKAQGIRPEGGNLHPLLKVRAEFREIFLEMGFHEMPTNQWVESSFWNFDALFQPQQHPVRDAHDTFFVATPKYAKINDQEYFEKVKNVHESGGYGSIGWRCPWNNDETRANIMRTHTTAVSARMLYQLGKQKEFTPMKFFSIDRVFRNEATDATHLAEFHQIEGVVVDYNLTLGHLIGVLNEFFQRLGIKSLRFKPAFNPYTEPSLEIFSYHEGLKSWVEIGNSGVFRPEMLLPMGLPKDVRAIAWGLSLERPTMIKYGIKNIRDLVGHKLDLKFVKDTPIFRFP